MKKDYFKFYGIPVSFNIDAGILKKIYYKNSKEYHPDFYTQYESDIQDKILELSTFNNKVYHILKDFDSRLVYILQRHGYLTDETQNKLPQNFLLEMMDINEALMDLQMDPDQDTKDKLINQIAKIEDKLLDSISNIIENYNGQDDMDLNPVKEYYLKKKYLLRIREGLNKMVD